MIQAGFMLSTGRAGTGTFAHLMQQSLKFRAFHVPMPELIKEAFEVQQNLVEPKVHAEHKITSIKELMRDQSQKIYIETNNKLYPFALELNAAFDAKFFWVIRDPFEYVNSGISRKWYTGAGGVWDTYRERPQEGWWAGATQVQKIAWQWCAINSNIEKSFSRLKCARVYHFSDLLGDQKEVLDLAHWLGGTDLTHEIAARIFGLKINVGRYSAPRDPATGDHIFGEINTNETESHVFARDEVKKVIQMNWMSPNSERYLG